MPQLSAFVGHSFLEENTTVVRSFLDFLDTVAGLNIGFSWDHAEEAEAKELPSKVLAKMEGKTLLIAICTSKEVGIMPDRLARIPLLPSKRMANVHDMEHKTSDWIIQEIGCGVGKDMGILVLLEDGLRIPGGLQGDMEYISFKRETPEASFPKILQMLRSFSSETSPAHIGAAAPVQPPGEPASPESTLTASPGAPQEDWQIEDYEDALLSSIIRDDIAAEEELTRCHGERFGKQDEGEAARWDALASLHKARLKRADTLSQIIGLAAKHRDNPEILSIMARAYEAYGQDDIAARNFEESAHLTDDPTKRLRRLCWSAEAFARAGHSDAARRVFTEVASYPEPSSAELASILAGLADVSKTLVDNDGYEALSEAYLELRPDDHSRRFGLAYHYSEGSQSDLAYYHYEILAKRSPSELGWNNLGVAAAQLLLPAASIHAYRQSEHLGGTLAMSNIAYQFIEAGFLEEAEDTAKKAMQVQDYDKRVAAAMGGTRTVLEAEQVKRREILGKIRPRLLFYREYAAALLKPQQEPFASTWQGPESELALRFDGRILTGNGSYPKKMGPFAAPLMVALGQKPSEATSVNITYKAEFRGSAASYRQWAAEGRLPNPDKDKPSATGMILISEDLTRIRVYQNGTRETELFYDLIPLGVRTPPAGA